VKLIFAVSLALDEPCHKGRLTRHDDQVLFSICGMSARLRSTTVGRIGLTNFTTHHTPLTGDNRW